MSGLKPDSEAELLLSVQGGRHVIDIVISKHARIFVVMVQSILVHSCLLQQFEKILYMQFL